MLQCNRVTKIVANVENDQYNAASNFPTVKVLSKLFLQSQTLFTKAWFTLWAIDEICMCAWRFIFKCERFDFFFENCDTWKEWSVVKHHQKLRQCFWKKRKWFKIYLGSNRQVSCWKVTIYAYKNELFWKGLHLSCI